MDDAKAKLVGANPGEIAENIVNAARAERVSLAEKWFSAGQRNVNTWLTESAGATTQAWAHRNGSKDVHDHPDFAAAFKHLMDRVCTCHRDQDECKVHDSSRVFPVSLADLVWWATDAMFDHVPSAVPSFSLAVVNKVTAFTNPSERSSAIPSFAHFLCEEKDNDS